jgi:hypothetical protein
MRVGEEIADLKNPNRVGTITRIERQRVHVAWNTGAKTTVGKSHLAADSRHYAITSPRPALTASDRSDLPSTIAYCKTAKGLRCLVCRAYCQGAFVRPWRASYWNSGRFEGKSTLLCSDRCAERLRRRMAE